MLLINHNFTQTDILMVQLAWRFGLYRLHKQIRHRDFKLMQLFQSFPQSVLLDFIM